MASYLHLTPGGFGFGRNTLTLKIERVCQEGGTRFRMSGELRSVQLEAARAEITTGAAPVILDLEEVNLVDIDGVRWLNACQRQGVLVENCAPYIREWMYQEILGGEK
jgi:hypothetical protein